MKLHIILIKNRIIEMLEMTHLNTYLLRRIFSQTFLQMLPSFCQIPPAKESLLQHEPHSSTCAHTLVIEHLKKIDLSTTPLLYPLSCIKDIKNGATLVSLFFFRLNICHSFKCAITLVISSTVFLQSLFVRLPLVSQSLVS